MIGEKYERLTVLSLSHKDQRGRSHYLCECVCGVRKSVQGALLRSGNTKSCGCLSAENRRSRRLPNDAGVIAQIILQYKRHARDRGISFGLSFEEVDGIVRKPCHYCGDPAGNIKRNKNRLEGFPHNGIDRMDSSRPYLAGNVVPCCGLCNKSKGTQGHDDFISWAKRISDKWSTQ